MLVLLKQLINMRVIQLNYLHHAFGVALSLLRNDKSKHFSKKLSIGESMYRMVESGNAQFPASSVYPLIQFFPQLEFEKVSKLLIAAKSMNGYSEHECVMTSQFLVEIDPELSPIFEHWNNSGRDANLRDEKTRRELGEKTVKYLTKPFKSKILELENFLTQNPESIDLLKKIHDGLSAVMKNTD
jgi:hypothetical protein